MSGTAKLYRIKNILTGDTYVDTVRKLADYSGLSQDTIKSMAEHHYICNGWECEKYVKPDNTGGTSTNKELDRLAKEAREHSMSYGQYVALKEGNWRHMYV